MKLQTSIILQSDNVLEISTYFFIQHQVNQIFRVCACRRMLQASATGHSLRKDRMEKVIIITALPRR